MAWESIDADTYQREYAPRLEAHKILAGVPLVDVWRVELVGGGPGRCVSDLRALLSLEEIAKAHPLIGLLFRTRVTLGRVFGWDTSEKADRVTSFLERVPVDVLQRSTTTPGSADGPFTLLYELEEEAVSEIRNATVHAFSVLSLAPHRGSYQAHWAIYVSPVSRWTGAYMKTIGPFRRWLVYPAILRHLGRTWRERYESEAPRPRSD